MEQPIAALGLNEVLGKVGGGGALFDTLVAPITDGLIETIGVGGRL